MRDVAWIGVWFHSIINQVRKTHGYTHPYIHVGIIYTRRVSEHSTLPPTSLSNFAILIKRTSQNRLSFITYSNVAYTICWAIMKRKCSVYTATSVVVACCVEMYINIEGWFYTNYVWMVESFRHSFHPIHLLLKMRNIILAQFFPC